MTRIVLWIIVAGLVLTMLQHTDCLICYRCSKVAGETATEANIKCLESSREIRCANQEDRCYSLASGPDVNEVEKDCARSTDCVGRICCDGDFCNAGLGIRSQVGSGKQCNGIDDCVQGRGEMTCSPGTPSELTNKCICTESTINFGAICRKAVIGEWCVTNPQCEDFNSACLRSRCVCRDDFFSNGTFCELKRPLGGRCMHDDHCGAVNSMCNGTHCLCQPGFIHRNTTSTCSGGQRIIGFFHGLQRSCALWCLYIFLIDLISFTLW